MKHDIVCIITSKDNIDTKIYKLIRLPNFDVELINAASNQENDQAAYRVLLNGIAHKYQLDLAKSC
jgi:hypothetical protein